MTPARKDATAYAVELLSKLAGKNASVDELEGMLNALTDPQFDGYMTSLMSDEETLPYIVPNLGDIRLNVDTNLKLAEELGHQFFERLWLTDAATQETYLTPEKYLIIDLPLKRLQQHLHKKISIPDNNTRVDQLTGQPTGDSQGSGVSFPELQILYSQNLESTIRELFKFRGGDEEAYKALSREILSGGLPSMDAVDTGDTRARSSETLKTLLKAAHIDNNL